MFSVEEVRLNKNGWQNWSGSVSSTPSGVAYPRSVEEVVSLVKQCAAKGTRLRVVGSGHSFTGLVQTDELMVSLDLLQGVESVDMDEGTAIVWAGTKLKRLGEELFEHGVAQENLGDINAQSIAGAVSTGTHGTGIGFGSLSTQLAGITAVTAAGEVVECSADRQPELFRAMRVSLGMLGIIVQVKLRVVPALPLRYESRRMPFDECLRQLERLKTENRHFEFYWFPYTNIAQVKTMNETEEKPGKPSRWNEWKVMAMENGVFWLLSEACRLFPGLCRPVSLLSAKGVPNVREVGYGHRLFATPRLVRFQEMEYNVPADAMKPVLAEIRSCVERNRFAVHFPIECRYVKGDDIWLSPAYRRDSAYIAVHMYRGMPYERYFACLEEIFQHHGGRPHWGKMHTMRAERLAAAYPMWNEFLRIREGLDPQGMFVNSYLSELIGIERKRLSPV
ncbi:L-gulono-1,4-lactone dehydrogenase [Paenibacillus sp. CECT 9249]|uniref:D-arabinono-1,4-lactone oxidase n=1 Tax=Paenibacillus sp. CECT 9249 TaxID=2845385 RepID=UPI001E621FFD|nr:D-arabinono-1,4-lactone oxidase [Paenibacillus sp. CECT 9249]CAH0118143.1 L-gulono-1,4-lactone dehydrogenase [Paenibacillus sp. CECT 9249]